jgi:hypothetical protein
MALDPSIPLAFRPPQIIDPVTARSNALNLRLREAQAKAIEDARAMEAGEREALRAYYGSDQGEQALAALARSAPAAYQAEVKRRLDADKERAGIAKTRADTTQTQGQTLDNALSRYRKALDAIDNPDAAAAWVVAQRTDPIVGPHLSRLGSLQESVARIPQDPAGFTQWRQQQALGMEKFLEQQRLGDNDLIQRDPTGRPAINALAVEARERIARAGVPTTPVTYLQGTNAQGQPEFFVAPTSVPRGGQLPTPIPTGIRTPAAQGGDRRAAQARNTLQILDEADKLIDEATGSLAGAGRDIIARGVGNATPGAQAIARLKVVETNLMLNMPRMEGPQSDRDVQLYREAAGQIGDPTVPRETKRAALQTIRSLNERYAAGPASAPAADPRRVDELLRKYGQQ